LIIHIKIIIYVLDKNNAKYKEFTDPDASSYQDVEESVDNNES
jgi:hypothetical protein